MTFLIFGISGWLFGLAFDSLVAWRGVILAQCFHSKDLSKMTGVQDCYIKSWHDPLWTEKRDFSLPVFLRDSPFHLLRLLLRAEACKDPAAGSVRRCVAALHGMRFKMLVALSSIADVYTNNVSRDVCVWALDGPRKKKRSFTHL